MDKSLNEIGKSEACDKADEMHSFKGESYFDVYDRFFSKDRHAHLNLLELGVRDGKSLRVWRKYFPYAKIVGIDINPPSAHQNTPGCTVEIMSQDDHAKLTNLSHNFLGWDIIIDDASHLNVLTAKSFEILWPHVRPGGFYIIEDLRVSYSNLSHLPDHWNFVNLHKGNPSRVNDRSTLNKIFFDLIQEMDQPKGDVRSVQFYHQMVIIEKIK